MKGGEKLNAIGMSFQKVQVPKEQSGKSNQTNTESDSATFQDLLSGEQETNELTGKSTSTKKASLNNDAYLIPDEAIPEDLQSIILSMVLGDEQTDDQLPNITLGDEQNMENIPPEIQNLLQQLAAIEAKSENTKGMQDVFPSTENANTKEVKMLLEELINTEQPYEVQSQVNADKLATLQKEFADVFAKAEELLSQITTKQDIVKMSPKILKLIQQWAAIERQSEKTKGTQNVLPSTENAETKEEKIWKTLIQTFHKREQLVSKQQYNTDAKVTTTDISKWIQNALDNHSQVDRVQGQQAISSSPVPMSKVEQYVIHLNQSQNAPPADEELIEQFQKVMKSSKFLAKPNGVNQLSIALRPHNLGEMMVRLTQIDGEMTVKIVVTSAAAKNMLESNMHQLKSMFSPQQVVIEKQDLTIQPGQDAQKEQNDGQYDEQEQNPSQHSDQRQNAETDDDFAAYFNEQLMNEKV